MEWVRWSFSASRFFPLSCVLSFSLALLVFAFSQLAVIVKAHPFFAGRLLVFRRSGSVGAASLSAGSAVSMKLSSVWQWLVSKTFRGSSPTRHSSGRPVLAQWGSDVSGSGRRLILRWAML